MTLHAAKKMLLLLAITCVLIKEMSCQAYIVRDATHPDYPNKCYFKGPPVTAIKIGEKRRLSGSCFEIQCTEGYTLHVTGCGLYASSDHCHVVQGDVSKPYPDCCQELVC